MKLKIIISILSLLSLAFAAAGGVLYYFSIKKTVVLEAERHGLMRSDMIKNNISGFLAEYIKPVQALATLDEFRKLLESPAPDKAVMAKVNHILDSFNLSLATEACYVMDRTGLTIASSNRNFFDSFVGKNFMFRPYFKQALLGRSFLYLALGTTSGKRGAYYSCPVYGRHKIYKTDSIGRNCKVRIIGVIVIKASIDSVEKILPVNSDEIFMITDPHGIIFISNRKKLLFKSFNQLAPDVRKKLIASKQFGTKPLSYAGFKIIDENYVKDKKGNLYLIHTMGINNLNGWKLVQLQNLLLIRKRIYNPILKVTAFIVFIFTILIGISIYMLYRLASNELAVRKKIEDKLRKSEERYRTIYHNTPVMLHSIDSEYRLISVSDHWLEATGYTRKEVIGRELTDFFTSESREKAENKILPEFFDKGLNKDIPYRFIKKDKSIMDILLSCYGIKDDNGKIVRTLAVSVDITEKKKEQKELELAKEELSRYSKELEKIVRKRTREITDLFRYTPAAIYIKDLEGRYRNINNRCAKLFNLTRENAIGKTDFEILPRDIAQQFAENDVKVLETLTEHRFTEVIRHDAKIYTYISVKFPVYGELNQITGVCSIATDITELQQTQDKLRKLSRTIMENQEKERGIIARELHDELGQILTALRMDSVWFENYLKSIDEKAAKRARDMSLLIDKTIDDVRSLAFQLRPGSLDDLGIVDAVESLINDFEKRTNIITDFNHDNIPDLNYTEANAVYRIIQEALTNAAKHSGASTINVYLTFNDNIVKAEIKDDGMGFKTDMKYDENRGLGLTGMEERASLAGGKLSVNSIPGKGTLISFSFRKTFG